MDGGAANNDLLMQFQADLLGVPVLRPKITETTALGVAKLAAMHMGFIHTQDSAKLWQLEREFTPTMALAEREQRLERWHTVIHAMLQMK